MPWMNTRQQLTKEPRRGISWIPPSHNEWKFDIDGSARGKFDSRSCGNVLRDDNNNVVDLFFGCPQGEQPSWSLCNKKCFTFLCFLLLGEIKIFGDWIWFSCCYFIDIKTDDSPLLMSKVFFSFKEEYSTVEKYYFARLRLIP